MPTEVYDNRAKSRTGKPRKKFSEEGRKHVSEGLKKYYESHEAKGHPQTEETKKKISESEILGKKKNKKTDEVIFIDENGNEQTVYQNKNIGNL